MSQLGEKAKRERKKGRGVGKDILCIGIVVFEEPVVEVAGDSVSFVEEIVDVARARVIDLDDGPERFDLALIVGRFGFGVAHSAVIFVKNRLDLVKPHGWRLGARGA